MQNASNISIISFKYDSRSVTHQLRTTDHELGSFYNWFFTLNRNFSSRVLFFLFCLCGLRFDSVSAICHGKNFFKNWLIDHEPPTFRPAIEKKPQNSWIAQIIQIDSGEFHLSISFLLQRRRRGGGAQQKKGTGGVAADGRAVTSLRFLSVGEGLSQLAKNSIKMCGWQKKQGKWRNGAMKRGLRRCPPMGHGKTR